MKQKIHDLLHKNEFVVKLIYSLIIINIVALVLESYKSLRESYAVVFQLVEVFSVIFFTIEYFLRIWVADLDERYKKSRFKFVLSPLGIIDLLAILPFYLPMFFAIDLRVIRILRLFRFLRIFKLSRFSRSFRTISQVVKKTKTDLEITIFIAFVLLILSSTLMYYVENDVQPDKFASIGDSLWWAVATLTTVGYGDVYPVTGLGKLIGSAIAMIGIGIVALPTGIISSAFVDELQSRKQREKGTTCECPKCGERFEAA
ncbi:MAG: ion transporter [Saprospiraceae bacterium]